MPDEHAKKPNGVVAIIVAALAAVGGAGGVYSVAADYNKDIGELRVQAALCRADIDNLKQRIKPERGRF